MSINDRPIETVEKDEAISAVSERRLGTMQCE